MAYTLDEKMEIQTELESIQIEAKVLAKRLMTIWWDTGAESRASDDFLSHARTLAMLKSDIQTTINDL